MGLIPGVFGKTKPKYEKELADVADNLAFRREKILRLQIQKKSIRSTILRNGLIAYFVLALLVATKWQPLAFPQLTGLVGGPVCLFLVDKLVKTVYAYWISTNEQQTKVLLAKQTRLVEELKQSTNFYSTQALLDRYGQSGEHKDKQEQAGKQKTDQPRLQPIPAVIKATNSHVDGPNKPQSEPTIVVSRPPEPPQSEYQMGWSDRILGAILGENELGVNSRHALICAKCRAHNGLAAPGQLPDEVRYKCPHCGHMNGSQDTETPLSEHKESETKNPPAC